jgi:hypothetical protein
MSLAKNFYDSSKPTKNLVTTITGVITLIITILVSFNVLTPEQSTELQTQTVTIINAVVGIWGAITAIILMFKSTDG